MYLLLLQIPSISSCHTVRLSSYVQVQIVIRILYFSKSHTVGSSTLYEHLFELLVNKQDEWNSGPCPPEKQSLCENGFYRFLLTGEGIITTLKWNLSHPIWRRMTCDRSLFLYFTKIATWPNILFSTFNIATCLFIGEMVLIP